MSTEGIATQTKLFNVLCLDGGGVRGLSSLLILKSLMQQLSMRPGVTDTRPCEIFDLICGTSTGGLTAIMLGRLRMSVDQAILCYLELSEKVFGKKPGFALFKGLAGLAMYDASTLEECIKKIVQDHGRPGDDGEAPLKDPMDGKDDICRTFIVAVTQAFADAPPKCFRSYSTDSPADECKIWEAARATTAMSTFFEPMKIGTPPQTYIVGIHPLYICYRFTYIAITKDGAFSGANNPSRLAREEISTLFPDRPIGCFLSLGTGVPDVVSVKGSLKKIAEACLKVVHSCESVADQVGRDFGHEKPYFRFSVDRGLGNIALDEWKLVPELTGITSGYMEYSIQKKRAQICVEVLTTRAKIVQPDNAAEEELSIT